MMCSFYIKDFSGGIFCSFENFPIPTLGKGLLHVLVPWNNHFCRIVLPVSGFSGVLYQFDPKAYSNIGRILSKLDLDVSLGEATRWDLLSRIVFLETLD